MIWDTGGIHGGWASWDTQGSLLKVKSPRTYSLEVGLY